MIEQVIKSFIVWNIYLTFFLPDPAFVQEYWRVIEYYYYVMYSFQSEFILYSYLNVKKLLAQNRSDIWSLSEQWLQGNIAV